MAGLASSGPRRKGPDVATPTLYVLLAAVTTTVQWSKWTALHRTRNLVALVLAGLILLIAAAYLLRAVRRKRQSGQ